MLLDAMNGNLMNLKYGDAADMLCQICKKGQEREVSIGTRIQDGEDFFHLPPSFFLAKTRRASEEIAVFFAEHWEAKTITVGISRLKGKRK